MFLDIRRDRYFALPPTLEAAFLDLAQAGFRVPAEPQDAVDQLRRMGLVEMGAPPAASTRVAKRANASWTDTPPIVGHGSLVAGLGALQAVVAMRRRLGRQRLELILNAFADLRGDRPNATLGALAEPVVTFARARQWAPIRPVCLLDALALLAFLQRRGLHADLVFGVIRQPFAAHCWVEAHGVVLNDRLDRVNEFTPILVI